ncbi:MAG: NYN domain-containing protein [Acidobacteriota bacterium]|jgi:hypothetical protein
MSWYLDGNNLMGRAGNGSNKDDREIFLARLLENHLPKSCIIVFDGPSFSRSGAAEIRRGRVRVVFSERRSADDVIVERVRKGDRVVSADAELLARAKLRGATPVSPAEFFSCPGPRGRGGEAGEEKPAVETHVEEWLRIFGGDE